ncbi:hypothetical protein BQ8794_60037 [Mesorhizobium prunaredense]|uniref:Uncharacterized protein n=1 Tax=Mesorhizobium prunaredense TaxID=1631249 RepID=A0A1R3VFL5_9HYPH|nr:hypothetical protein BQ8794_60037 [Mesorhizobium prunaredense]
MLRNGGLRQVEMVDDLAAAAGAAGRKVPENFDPGRMRKRGELRGDGLAVGEAAGLLGQGSVHRLSAIDDE